MSSEKQPGRSSRKKEEYVNARVFVVMGVYNSSHIVEVGRRRVHARLCHAFRKVEVNAKVLREVVLA